LTPTETDVPTLPPPQVTQITQPPILIPVTGADNLAPMTGMPLNTLPGIMINLGLFFFGSALVMTGINKAFGPK